MRDPDHCSTNPLPVKDLEQPAESLAVPLQGNDGSLKEPGIATPGRPASPAGPPAMPEDLKALADCWPTLDPAVKAALLALVAASARKS